MNLPRTELEALEVAMEYRHMIWRQISAKIHVRILNINVCIFNINACSHFQHQCSHFQRQCSHFQHQCSHFQQHCLHSYYTDLKGQVS